MKNIQAIVDQETRAPQPYWFDSYAMVSQNINFLKVPIFNISPIIIVNCRMNRGQPLNPLDRNRYLYDEPTTREPSVGQYSKVSEIEFSNCTSQSVLSKHDGHHSNKENVHWQDKKTLKEFGRELNYKVLTEHTDDEESSAHKFLLLMMENERLRLQIGQNNCEAVRCRSDYEGLVKQKDSLVEMLRISQSNETQLREQLRLRELKIEEIFESIKKMYEKNNELGAELSAAKRELTLNKSRTVSELESITSRKELTQLRTKLTHLESQDAMMRIKLQNEKEELNFKLEESEQRLVKREQELTLQIQQLEDSNRSLKFEISRLKADLNTKLTKEKEIHCDLSRAEGMLRTRQNELKEESRRWFKKVQDLELQKTTLLHSLLKNSQEKDSLSEELRISSQNLKARDIQLQQLTKIKQSELQQAKKRQKAVEAQYTSELSCKVQKIKSIEISIDKQKSEWNNEKQQLQRTINISRKQIQDLKKSITTYEQERSMTSSDQIMITKLRAQNGSLKDEISDQYKSILMFENKVKAYENRISILETIQQTTSTCTYAEQDISVDAAGPVRERRQKRKIPERQFDRQSERQASRQLERYRRTNEREVERNRQRQRQKEKERERYHSHSLDKVAIENDRKRLLHHYPSSSLLAQHERVDNRQEWRRYASRDRLPSSPFRQPTSIIYQARPMTPTLSQHRFREQPINVSLPMRRDRLILHDQHRETLNEAIVRKCKILS